MLCLVSIVNATGILSITIINIPFGTMNMCKDQVAITGSSLQDQNCNIDYYANRKEL